MSAKQATAEAVAGPSSERAAAGALIFRIARWSIALGMLIEVLVIILLMIFGDVGGLKVIVADTVKKFTWPFFVCVGIELGKTAAKVRAPKLEARMMGIAGLIAAPAAFNVARIIHEGLGTALSLATSNPSGWVLVSLSALKSVQYGFLGAALGWVASKPWGDWKGHALIGLITGIVFGITALVIDSLGSDKSLLDFATGGVNELLVPIGCALIVYSSDALVKHLGRP